MYQVVPYYPPHIGGMEVVAQEISEALSKRGYQVNVLTSTIGQGAASVGQREAEVRIRRLRTIEFAHTPFMPTLFFHLLRAPRDAILHVHVGVAYTPEIVWLYSKIFRRRYVAHYHLDVDPSGPLGWLFVAYKRYVLKAVLRSASRVLAVSADQPSFLTTAHTVPADSVILLPNGVGAQFSPVERKPPSGRPLRLLFVGRLAPQKNVPLLLAGLSEMKNPAELVIVGEGEDQAVIEKMIRELNLKSVRLVGAKHGQGLVDAYQNADVLVMTSVKESTGLVLLEAFATGLPVVATDAPGTRETVGQDGLLPAPVPGALALYLDMVASDSALWLELANRSVKRASMHSWGKTLDDLESVYAEVYSSSRTGSKTTSTPPGVVTTSDLKLSGKWVGEDP